MRATLYAALSGLALALATATASASDVYPEHIATKYGLECAPGCALCHNTSKGGPKMINVKFGLAARTAGLNGGANLTQLDTALAKMQTDGINSDTDPDPDIQEMINGGDPNEVGADLCAGPKYGCGASTIASGASRRGLDPSAALAGSLLVVAGLLLMRRQR